MKRISLIAGLIVLCVWVGFLIRPQIPSEIAKLRLGNSIEAVHGSVVWIKPDAKDHDKTWWSGQTLQDRYGVEYNWVFDLSFDQEGGLIGIEGRSYNHITGFLDKTYKLSR